MTRTLISKLFAACFGGPFWQRKACARSLHPTNPKDSFFSEQKPAAVYSVFWAFLETQIVQQCVKIVFLQNLGDVKNEVFEKKIAFFVFSFFMLET